MCHANFMVGCVWPLNLSPGPEVPLQVVTLANLIQQMDRAIHFFQVAREFL